MAEHGHLDVPHARLPSYLEGLQPPVSMEEALEYAEEHGASPDVLAFIESLPAAVFTSEEGMRHAFSHVREEDLPHLDPEQVLVGQDGTSS